MAKKKNREFDTSPMALGRQQKNSAAQKADQKRSASSNGKNNPRVAKNNTQSTAPIAYRSEQATKRAGRNQERLANQRRVQSGGTAQQMREQKTNLGQKPKQMSFTEKQEQAQQKVAERKAGKKETGNRFLANEKQVGVNKENRFADITAGTLKQIGGGHLTSLGHDSNDYNEFKKNLEQQVINGKISESTMNKNLEAYKRANTKANRDQDWQDSKLHKTFQKIEQKGQELNAKGDAQVEKAKEGLGTGGKLLADAYSSTLGMASDMMLGPAWAASMMSRSYGNTLNSTRELVDKGIITEKEAENNAGLQAIKEAATEYMFAGAGLAKGLKGVGKATEAFEGQLAKGIDKLAARIPEGILRNAGYSTLKSLGGIAEESTEELAGGILDPILTNLAYGNKAYERTEGAQVRSNLQMNSMSLQDQLNALVAQGYDREEMLNMYASEIGSEEYKAETIADLMNSGYSEKEANKLAAQMQNYMLASLSGDEKALKKAEDSVVREFGKYSDIRSSFSWSETGEAMASAAIMVAATGAPGMATRNQQGAAIKKAYEDVQGGRNAASNISWSALTLDDEKMASRAQAMYEQAQKGEDLANEQYAELHQALMKQRDINVKNAESSYETARKMADKDRLFARGGTNGVDENNNVIYTGAVTQRAATTLRGEISVQLAQAEEAFGQMDDAEKHDTIEGITSVLLGQATPDSVESLTTNHPIARSIYESITGEKLPASNEATRNALFEASANNYVEMARAETVEAIDVGKGGIDENYMNQFGSEGQDVYKKLSDGKSVEDSTAYVDYVSTISKVYDAGAKGLSEKAAIELAATQGISEADAKELYEAGKSDATTSAGGRVTTSFKNGGNLRNSAREVYMAIAKMFNVNIELTDDISVEVEVDAKKSKDKTDESEDGENKQNKEKVIRQANGQYDAKTNTLTLNLNEDITKNIGYTVMHELTHKIKTNNLAGYKAFARMFEERWIEKNGKASLEAAINERIERYKGADELSRDDAIEEIIADQMGELLHDRAFISRFAAEETDGAASVLSAIRDIIRKITQLFAVHGGFRSDYNEALLSELGLLREAEMFFANSIQEARSQQTQEMLEKGNESGDISFSIGGYDGKSMSNRARAAYSQGEKPLSKWSKSVIIEEIENDIDGVDINELRRLTKDELVNNFLKYSSWHHTGSLYNVTSFYSINRDADFSKDNIDRIINERKVSKKPKADKRRDVEVGAISDDIYNKLNIVYNSGSTGLKTIAGVFSRWKNMNDIDTMYNEALEKIRTLDANKVEGWRNLPEDHWRREYVDLYDNNIEAYANKVYSQTINRKSKLYKDIKADIDSRHSGDETEFKYSIDSEGRELTQQQEKYFQDSKVRDENGQLLVVYHGTSAEFDVFKNTGSGHYFTANPKYAERYGSNVRAFYLNIVKPFDVTQDSVKDDFVQFVRDGYSNSLHPTTSIADIYKAIENGIDWTEADNLIEWIEENELDYDGLIIDEGGDLDENGEVFDRGNSYVSFNSNQAKLTSNENPTEDKRMKFSMDAPYEETKDLVAVHNVKESDIAGLLKLQGIPMPSIAVIKAAQGHDMYGEYSFIFGKDTIDPAKNKANKVYGGDAWTPVFPTVEYEVRDDKAFDAFRKKIADLKAGARKEVRDTLYGLDYTDMFNDKLRSNNGLEKFKEALLEDTRMMQVFLNTKGQYVDTIVKKEETTMSPAEIEKHKFIIDKLGEDVVRASVPPESHSGGLMTYRKEYVKKNEDAIKQAYKAYGMEIFGLPEDVVDQTIEGMNLFELFKIPRTALQYLDEGPTKVKETPDYRGTEDAIREKTDEAEYKKWLDNLFAGLTIQEGLYNGKDYYTPSGNRRTFKETHMDATLDNIVKAMKLHENGETMLGHSFKAVAQKKYDSIADIKADSKRLEKMSEEEYSEKNKEFADRESKIIDRFFDDVKIGAYDNPFIIRDTINTILVDSIRNAKSSADVLSELKEYPYTKNATKADADAIWQLVEDVANMPTGYFEAKPERAVTFDEVQAVIAPDNAPSEIIDGLKEQNVDVVTYEAGNEEDRKNKLNSLDNVKFSIDANSIEQSITQMESETRNNLNSRGVTIVSSKAELVPIVESIIKGDETELKYSIDAAEVESELYKPAEETEERVALTPVVSEDAVIKYSISKTDDSTSFIEDCLEGDTSDEAQARRQKARDELEAALADIVRKDTQLTYGKTLNRKSVKKPIKELVFGLMESSENTHRDKMDMVDFVMDSADAIWYKFHNKDTDLSDLMLIVSREVVENIKFIDDEMYQAYQDLRRYLRNNRISVPEFLKEDISWADYRKKNFGRMRLVSGTGHSIDAKWEEIVPLIQPFVNEKNYGNGYGLLEVENEAEMFFALDEALDNTKAYRDAYADGFAQDIEIQFAKDLATITLKQGEAWESFADKKKKYYETRAKEMQARHKVAMRELREQRDKKLAEAEQKRKDDLAKQKQEYKEREEKRKAEEREKKEKQKAKKQDHRARMKAFGHIEKNYNWLTKRLLDPKKEDDQHIPEGFINSLASVLSAFDLQTERSKSLEERTGKVSKPTEALRKMREELQELSKEDESGIFVYNGALFSIMDNLIKSLDGHPLRDLNTEDLTNIDDMLASIKHMIQNENRLFADAKKQAASSAGDAIIKESKEKIARYGRRYERKGLVGELDHILNEDMMTPMNFFKSLGTQMRGLYKHLRYGQDDYIRKIDELRNIFDDMFKPYRKKGFLGHARSGSVIEEWQNDKSAQTFKVASGEEVTMSVAQMMSLYCLSKREQAMQHILGNGVVLSDVKMTKLMDKVTGKVERSALSVRLTYDDVIKITDSLTQEQKELAQKMQELMNGKLQEWGNETSMQLYGIRLFKEKNYFPIESSDWYLPGEIGKASGIKGNKITSFGFTKPLTEGANNPIVIGDIFDIVTDHANKMALYSAYAAPLTDFNRVMNYVKRDEETGLIEGSVKQVLQDAYGPRAIKFIDNLLDDINGQANTRMDGIKELINKSLSNYKSAAIGFNLRVLVQQPTAILRATYYINPKYFINPSEANLKKNVREMHEHCPIAVWKSWGNYQNDFSRGLQDIITNNSNSMWETMTMGIYGFADDMTWGMIWGAVKNEIKAKHPNVEYGSEEFWILCNERASLVFDETQVVDSVFHRSDAMRNKDTATKMVTSFMSEPTRTYNMIRSSIVMSYRMVKDGDTVGATKEMTKAITVFITNAAAVSAAAAVVDALRGKGGDDDDDWYELWMANFLSNLKNNGNLLNNIVWIKDISGMIVNAMSGEYLFGTSNMALEGWYKFARGLADIKDVMSGDMSIFEFITGDFGSGLGYITGIPTFNMLREVKTLWTKLGLPVFAEDGTVESSSGTGESVLTEGIFSKLGIGPSEAERYAKHTDKLTKKYSGKSDENMLEMATDGYRKLVDNRDFSELSARREAIRRAGGDVDAFDEKIHSYVGTSYKKTIGDSSSQEDFDSQQAMKDWMLSNGWTEQQISDVVYRSDTAREFKAACRMLDHDAAVTALTPLLEAGLTEQDIYKLWNNRNRGNYDTSSTGTYVWGTEGTITSGFGNRGYVTPGASSYHQGIDIGAEMGTKVVAADGGVVTFAGNDGSGYGNYIIVTHDNGTQTYYGHLSCIGVRKGQRVSQSQPIGNVGSTGISTGPHLHFAMKINGSFVDPSKYIKK